MKTVKMVTLVLALGFLLTSWIRSAPESLPVLQGEGGVSGEVILYGRNWGTLPTRLRVEQGVPCLISICQKGFGVRTYDLGTPERSGEVVVSLMDSAFPVLHAARSGQWVACNPHTLGRCLEGAL